MAITFEAGSGDIEFKLVSGVEASRQRIQQRLRLWLGEHFINRLAGVAWRQIVFARPASAALAEQVVTAVIRSVDGVTGVEDVRVTVDRRTRVATVSARVITDDGVIDLTGDAGSGV